jgi:RHS repeat-associated protein
MTSFVARVIVRSLVVSFITLLIVSAASAQISNVTGDQAPPIEGAGHDYIHLLNETVNPGNGSVSLRINLPVPPSRGFSVPFSIGYDSNAALHYSGLGWTDNSQQGLGQGGWSYIVPFISVLGNEVLYTGNPPPQCSYFTNYLFTELNGTSHALPLASIEMPGFANCYAYSGPWNPTSSVTGGDVDVQAVTTTDFFSTSAEPPPPVTVSDVDGTVYYFSATLGQQVGGNGAYRAFLPDWIEDRNGNKAVLTPTTWGTPNFTVTDTAGRAALIVSGFGSTGNTVSVSGTTGNYAVSWGASPITPPAPTVTLYELNPSQDVYYGGCAHGDTSFSTNRISQITLPNKKSYTFLYDQNSSLLSQVTYPSGGYMKYTWAAQSAWDWSVFPANQDPQRRPYCETTNSAYLLQTRTVSFDGKTVVEEQDFTYSPTWITCGSGNQSLGCQASPQVVWSQRQVTVVTKTLQNGSLQPFGQTVYTYTPFLIPNIPDTSVSYGSSATPVESEIDYEDASGTLLRKVTEQWVNPQLQPSSVKTQLDTGQTSQTTRTFACGSFCLETDEYSYDYGPSSSPGRPGALLKRTHIDYASFASTPIFPAGPSISDRPSDVIEYDGNGNKMAETDYTYDGTAVQSVSSTEHDETYYSTSYNNRGNATTETVKCLQTGCANAVTSYAYYETGQLFSMTDPCGNGTCGDMTGTAHTTNYSYSDSYTILSGGSNENYTSPNGNTNAYLTEITNPLGQTENFTYDYNNGQLTVSTDENSQSTKYLYNDPFSRPTQINYPDGGETQYAYNDSIYNSSFTSPTPSVTITQAISSTLNKISTVGFDGIGHAVVTILSSDPQGSTYAATSYYGTGKPYQAYNPTRCSSIITNCDSETTWGVTTYTYDALGRTIQVTEPDTSTVLTSYSGNQTTLTDEANNQRTSTSDALGRLTVVSEAPGVSGYNFTTQYQYDALNNLICVVQKGTDTTAFTSCAAASTTWRPRSFVYDSLSRLTSATNPESGKIAYAYDANSNLSSKTAPSPNQAPSGNHVTTTYTYDALNRLTGKSYNDTYTQNPVTPSVSYGYDGVLLSCPDPVGFAGKSATNGIGRRTAMCFSAGSKSWQYDPMGRISDQNDRFIGLVAPLYKYNIFTNSAGVQSTTTDTEYNYYLNGDLSIVYYPGQGIPTEEFYTTENGAGRIISAGDAINHALTSGVYTPDGQLATAEVCANDCNTSNTYNSRLQPVLISTSTTSGTKILNLTYNFNPGHDNGNVVQIANGKDSNRTQNFLYDPLNRIWQAYTNGPNWGDTYSENTYAAGTTFSAANAGTDAWGNLAHRSGVTGKGLAEPMMDCPANTNNQLTTCGYGYDPAGNMTSNGSISYVYDAENRLIAAGGDSYLYDGDGQRIEKCTEGTTPGTCASNATGTFYWLQVGGGTLAESDLGGNWTAAYGLTGGQIMDRVDLPANVVHYYFHDHLHSTNIVTDGTGNIKNESDYSPYGVEIVIASGDFNRYKFTGKERDSESGLDNFGARYNASALGRFMTPDGPLIYASTDDPQSWNLYSYVRNNPLNRTDPNGHLTVIIPGTGASSNDWNMNMQLVNEAKANFHDSDVRILSWSGQLGGAQLEAGAQNLAAMVNAHPFAPGEQLNVIGHSRGGDVALEATQHLNHKIDNLVTLATPVYQTNDDGSGNAFLIDMSLIGTWINVTTAQDWVAPADSTMRGHYPGAYNLRLNAAGYGHIAAHSAIYQDGSLRQQWWKFLLSHTCRSWITTDKVGGGRETTCAD